MRGWIMCKTLFDVAFSFSGKERDFVRQVKDYLEQRSISVFMDEDHSITIWGNDLEKTFEYLYGGRAKYYIIFVSENYIKSLNTVFEFSAMLKNLHEKGTSNILQIFLDDTTLNLLPPIGAIKINDYDSQRAGELIVKKIQGESLDKVFQYLIQRLDEECNNKYSNKILCSKKQEGIYCFSNSHNPKRCYRIQIQYMCINDFEKILVYDSFSETGNTMTFPTGEVYKDNGKMLFLNYGFCCDNYQFEITSKQLLQLINEKIIQIK